MAAQRTDGATEHDFSAMQRLIQGVWPSNPRWHVGELAWSRYSLPGTEAGWRTAIWYDGGRPLAWGWVELPGDLSLVVDPSAPELVDAVLRWLGDVAGQGEHACTPLETETHLIERLEAAGFEADLTAPYFRYHSLRLGALPEPLLPEGFHLRHVEPGEDAERAAVHRAFPYRLDLDWVVVASDGTWVASALGWLDEVNRSGILEPVGCDPTYRGLGLARAVSLACLRSMRDAGALTGHVNPRGDDAYPVPGLLYRSIGFEPGPRTVTYVRPPLPIR